MLAQAFHSLVDQYIRTFADNCFDWPLFLPIVLRVIYSALFDTKTKNFMDSSQAISRVFGRGDLITEQGCGLLVTVHH